jgi:hypothetical protein
MSADNWTTCPECKIAHAADRDARMRKVAKSYGKVPAEEYERMAGEARREPIKVQDDTLREDYEIGTNAEGMFSVGYSCSCTKCGWSFKFKHQANALERKV